MTEKQLQQAIVGTARLLGWRVYHTFDSRRSEAGFPDLVLVRRGHLIFAELKTKTGGLSPAQDAWLDDLGAVSVAAHHVWVYLWRPDDWTNGSVEAVLRETGRQGAKAAAA